MSELGQGATNPKTVRREGGREGGRQGQDVSMSV